MSISSRYLSHFAALFIGLTVTSAAVLLDATPALADDNLIYVDAINCSPGGNGTQSAPYCTISHAASVVVAGKTVLVAAGTYPEKVTVPRSGTANEPIEFRAVDGASVVVTGGTNGFAISSRAYVRIIGFTITNTTSRGIYVSGSNNIVLSGNTVTGAGTPVGGQVATGIYLSGTTDSIVTANYTHHNSDTGIYLNASTSNTTVVGNHSSWNAREYQRSANGINVIGPNNGVIGNVVHDNEDSGLQFYTGASNVLAVNNVTYNNGDHGIDNLNVAGGRLIGNTVYRNCTSGINVEGTSSNFLLANNIAVDNAVYPAYNGISCNRRRGNIGIYDSAPSTTTVDHNLVWLSTPGTMYYFNSAHSSLTAMQQATGQEQHGIQDDPRFAAAGVGDLRLTTGSAAIDSADSGVSGAEAQDVMGNARVDDPSVPDTGSGPRTYDDRGAYEFIP
ncbi:MAG TPA: right-handed parallel beta-helix repeat-containing protein [Micromonosporaceae bacterium]|nr:right-handed parallel beta-helix repeat-containing protein [Micromonosporaceae bacterium]